MSISIQCAKHEQWRIKVPIYTIGAFWVYILILMLIQPNSSFLCLHTHKPTRTHTYQSHTGNYCNITISAMVTLQSWGNAVYYLTLRGGGGGIIIRF